MRFSLFLLPASLLLHTACQRTEHGSATPGVSVAPLDTTTPNAPLRETRWVLRRIASQPVGDTTGGHQPFLLITDAGTVSGQASCNRFQGTLQPVVNDGELLFSPLRTTRMSCTALSTEVIYTKALQNTRAYRIKGDTLWLYGNTERTGTALARLEAAR